MTFGIVIWVLSLGVPRQAYLGSNKYKYAVIQRHFSSTVEKIPIRTAESAGKDGKRASKSPCDRSRRAEYSRTG